MGLLPIFVGGKPASGATNLPDDFEQSQVATGSTRPTAMEFAPDGRLFVAEKVGALRVIDENDENNSGLQTEPFVDISDQVSSQGERGLLGIAFHPDFGNNPYVYVYYTRKASDGTPAHNRVVRFKANGNAAVEGSEEIVFRLDNLHKRGQGSDNHNGGAIHFGTDDKLYVAVGDNKRDRTAQSMNTVLGKMLRINADGSIPTDNPFYTNPEDKNDAIWAKGLRNPYTFAVQPQIRVARSRAAPSTILLRERAPRSLRITWATTSSRTSAMVGSGCSTPVTRRSVTRR